jgi:hypothetical protein
MTAACPRQEDGSGQPGVSGRPAGDAASAPPAAPSAQIPPACQSAGPWRRAVSCQSAGPWRDAPGGATHAPRTGHRPHAAGKHDHKARHCDQDDIDHDPGERQPDADQEPRARLGAPAPIAHPRAGRMDGAGKPRVVGTKAPARSARAGAARPARRSSATGHTGSAAGPPPPYRTSSGSAPSRLTNPWLAHRASRGHRGRSAHRHRAAAASPQASHCGYPESTSAVTSG